VTDDTPPLPPLHLVTVTSPSARRETWAVARAVFHLVYWSALLVSAQTYRAPNASDAGAALAAPSPFERPFQDLPSADQRLFRSVQEGLVEAERARASTGRWPDVDALARAYVRPFAPDPIDRGGYTWRLARRGLAVDYVGTPTAGSGREGIFVVILEPEPNAPDDPLLQPDETHHRLTGGPMIHASIWMGPPLVDAASAFAEVLPERGYRQIVAKTRAP
jgi:hypothetical protein